MTNSFQVNAVLAGVFANKIHFLEISIFFFLWTEIPVAGFCVYVMINHWQTLRKLMPPGCIFFIYADISADRKSRII